MTEAVLRDRQYELRDGLASSLEQDLVGYEYEEEMITDAPATRYVAGILFAPELRVDELIDQVVEASEEGQVQDSASNDADGRYPSSMGLTFAVQEGAIDSVIVRVEAARYVPVDGDGVPLEVGAYDRDELLSSKWRRVPLDLSPVQVAIVEPEERPYAVDDGLELWARVREPDARGRVPITVVLRNTTAKGTENELRDLSAFFQVRLSVAAEDDAEVFVDRTGEIASVGDEDMETQQLLYRHARSFATGHGCSVKWTKPTEVSEYATALETTFVPRVEVRTSVSNPEITNPALSMEFCDKAGTAELIDALTGFVSDYESWIEAISRDAGSLDPRYDVAAARNIKNCKGICERLRLSVSHLESDATSRRAFRAANAAMRVQRARSVWSKLPKNERGELAEHMNSRWRPFQLGFLLLSLRGVADPASGEREIADLLWFPTGGGKTEAYLGLIAFALFRRRLANDSATAAGTTVIMRYTLRLLTLQQFARAATLICACEQIRREASAEFGDSGISIGLWVGEAATPNTLKDAEEALKELRAGKSLQKKNPKQLEKCPWCGGRLSWKVTMSPRELKITCKEKLCEFADGLPIKVVDEDIYAKPTSLLIATSDKFAQMTWNSKTAALFGLESEAKPPELIIQDELHLISGPLGTLAALYETVVDRVCTAAGVRPKVIASTATIRRAESQTEGLFDRRMMQFPPPGIDARDSYFAIEADPGTQASRLYAGVMSTTASQTTSLVRTYSKLLADVEDSDADNDVRDPYWTLLGYFNSLRILGAAMLQVQDDVTARMKQLRGGIDTERRMEIQEMTSRVESGKIPELLERLATSLPDPDTLDVVLATNMISVGVDVDRLGLMAVMGQPQGTAEYIQATSRVGRRHPGLVATIFNSRKSRDRSHFENFRTYHEALYRQVESTSVTPFASRARQRGVHAVLVALLRQTVPGLRADASAGAVRDFEGDVDAGVRHVLERVESVDPLEVDNTRRELEKFVAEWRKMAEQPGLVYRQSRGKRHALLKDAADDTGLAFPTLNSLRDVDSECSLAAVGA